MSWRDDMERQLSVGDKTPTHAEILKELRSEWRWHRHVKNVAEREMEIRRERFAEVEQDALRRLGDKFMNENQIFWDDPDKPEK